MRFLPLLKGAFALAVAAMLAGNARAQGDGS